MIFNFALVLSALLCSLVAGLLFAYAIVVMPGIRALDNKHFIKTFQVTDRIIQNRHPLFMLVWVGSAVAITATAIAGFNSLHGIDLILMLAATGGYLMGVQAPTIAVNLPLNAALQRLDVEHCSEEDLQRARLAFEQRWNKFNQIRTAVACGVTVILLVLLLNLN